MLWKCLLISCIAQQSLAELLFTIAIYRHGDRAPYSLPYPQDKYDSSYWPRGWNELTAQGIDEMHQLGRYLRKRYVTDYDFLDETFDPTEVIFRSSVVTRAMESAIAVTEGMYPPEPNHIGLSEQIPIETTGERRNDPLLRTTEYFCPVHDALMYDTYKETHAAKQEKYGALIDLLRNYTGMTDITLINAHYLMDITKEIAHNLTQPSWLYESYAGKPILEHIKDLSRISRMEEIDTPQKLRLRSGLLINEWLNRLTTAATYKDPLKAVFDSSHSTTISVLTAAMELNLETASYGDALVAELHEIYGNHIVQLWYIEGGKEAKRLTLPRCDYNCPLQKFIEILEPIEINSKPELEQLCSSCLLLKSISILFIVVYWLLDKSLLL